MFIQSRVPEHSELHLLLSMITPLGWLERVPTYKDQQEQLKDKDLATYGFLGYPLLQSADILLYKAGVRAGRRGPGRARRDHARSRAALQSHLRPRAGFRSEGREGDQEPRQPQRHASTRSCAALYQEQGDAEALEKARALLEGNARLTLADRERLLGYLEGTGRSILAEPEALLTATPKVPGLDGRKMSKSYGNTIGLREDPDSVAKKLKTMQTDPARVRRTDPGDPDKCPVWDLHKIYSDADTRRWVQQGCRTAGIGCLDCKKPLIDVIVAEITAIRAARAGIRGESRPRARHHCRRLREGARRCAPDARGSAAGDGHELPVKPRTDKLVENTGSQLGPAERLADGARCRRSSREMPFAVVEGEPVTELPRDLYIPPDALQVFLEAFEGPLDLLLYLIRRQNLDILDIPIAEITRQYMQYIEVMADLQLELAGEYLLMAAMLAEIKSRMLLPRPPAPKARKRTIRAPSWCAACRSTSDSRKRPRTSTGCTRMERDTLPASAELVERKVVKHPAAGDAAGDAGRVQGRAVARAEMFAHHHVSRERLSVRAAHVGHPRAPCAKRPSWISRSCSAPRKGAWA